MSSDPAVEALQILQELAELERHHRRVRETIAALRASTEQLDADTERALIAALTSERKAR